jgi:hypothetical protein
MHTRGRRSAKVDVRAENLDNEDSIDSIDDLRTERGWGEEDPDEVRTAGFEYDRYGGGRRATPERASGRFGDSVSARLHARSQGEEFNGVLFVRIEVLCWIYGIRWFAE